MAWVRPRAPVLLQVSAWPPRAPSPTYAWRLGMGDGDVLTTGGAHWREGNPPAHPRWRQPGPSATGTLRTHEHNGASPTPASKGGYYGRAPDSSRRPCRSARTPATLPARPASTSAWQGSAGGSDATAPNLRHARHGFWSWPAAGRTGQAEASRSPSRRGPRP